MIKIKRVLNVREELSNWLDEPVIGYIARRRLEGWTYKQIATDLSQSGYTVQATTVAGWSAAQRKKDRE